MTADLWDRLKPLYHAALDLPEDDRAPFVERMCGNDVALARELSALLAANGEDSAFETPFVNLSLLLAGRPAVLAGGVLLADRFRIVRHLGSGGMGDVYEALDEQMERGRIALKTIRPVIAANPVALARFKEEVRLARQVSGPNVCRIHELYLGSPGAHGTAVAFLTMELLEGVTLHERIAQSSPLPLAEVSRVAEQLCTALGCIHEAGIVHGDLKPRNVMLVPHHSGERTVVMDFGLARTAVPTLNSDSTPATTGPVAGTPNYMAPEQFEGGEMGPPTDLYALGLILYELATGIQPFAAPTPLAAAIRRSKRPAHVSAMRHDLPPAWDNVITRCLQYDVKERFQSAEEVKRALTRHDTLVLRLGRGHRLAVPRVALLAAGLAAVVLLCGSLWFGYLRPRHRELAPDAAHWYELGMTALREGSYMKATRLLTMVTNRDPTYALAHAALADAWTELDFTDAAQKEMLLAAAPDEQHGLSEMDRRYIDAVRTTLIRDYTAAAQDYEAILKELPQDEKARGYVDLGRIYEKAGKVKQTLASYEEAAALNKDDPAPFLHLGILKSRLREGDAANTAFDHAETLYSAESDQEGLAEVAYQRGYAADQAGHFAEAEERIERSLGIARQIANVQMQVRSLTQLSSIADNRNLGARSVELAGQALAAAREAGLEYWATDSLVRLGNALLTQGQFPAAETNLSEALWKARQNGHPRLEAFAQLSLASLYDQGNRPGKQIAAANAALRYYRDYGFLDSADRALLLLMRGQLARAEYGQALTVGKELLETATRTQDVRSAILAEELMGRTLLSQQQYPQALLHFRNAVRIAQPGSDAALVEQFNCADTLWRLGRMDQARAILTEIEPELVKRSELKLDLLTLRAEQAFTEGDLAEVLKTAKGAETEWSAPQLNGTALQHAQICAELASDGHKDLETQLAGYVTAVNAAGDRLGMAQADAMSAALALRHKTLPEARVYAARASEFFQAAGMRESEMFLLLLVADIEDATGDRAAAAADSRRSLDLLEAIHQSWNETDFGSYSTRHDVQSAVHALQRLSQEETTDVHRDPSNSRPATPLHHTVIQSSMLHNFSVRRLQQ